MHVGTRNPYVPVCSLLQSIGGRWCAGGGCHDVLCLLCQQSQISKVGLLTIVSRTSYYCKQKWTKYLVTCKDGRCTYHIRCASVYKFIDFLIYVWPFILFKIYKIIKVIFQFSLLIHKIHDKELKDSTKNGCGTTAVGGVLVSTHSNDRWLNLSINCFIIIIF
jgi:hypothetical protein